MPALLGSASLIILIIIVLLVISPVSTTFNVTAITERIGTSIDVEPQWVWNLDEVELIAGGMSHKKWSGGIKLNDSTDVTIERKALGNLLIHVRCRSGATDCTSAGQAFDEDGLVVIPLPNEFNIRVSGLEKRAREGETVLLELTGDMTLGRSVGRESAASVGLLRSSRIEMLGRTIVGDGKFAAGSAELSAGDKLTMADVEPGSRAHGFVTIDERPAMTAAYRVIARKANVYRPGGGVYTVSTSIVARFLGDPIFRVLAAIFVAGAALAQFIGSSLDLWDRYTNQG